MQVPLWEVMLMLNLDNNIVKSIKAAAEKYAIRKIILFGSRARGDNKATSDIDIAVYPLQQFNNEGHFISDIDDLDTLLKIDVVFIYSNNRATKDQKLIENIEKEGIVIYERS